MTAYTDFVKQEMRLRPAGTRAQEWMKVIGQRWQEKKKGVATTVATSVVECVICMHDHPLSSYAVGVGRCMHEKTLCSGCRSRVDRCPYCRVPWGGGHQHEPTDPLTDYGAATFRARRRRERRRPPPTMDVLDQVMYIITPRRASARSVRTARGLMREVMDLLNN
jgi:hypothetical protein